MNHDDDHDIRDALARAHERAPDFERVADNPMRKARASRIGLALAFASVAAAVGVYLAWPSADDEAPPVTGSIYIDLSHPALATTTIATPLDSLLDVPGLDVLETTPQLATGGLP